jgi:hypothetical protein
MALRYGGSVWFPSDNAVGYDVTIGDFSSATVGFGKALSSAKLKVFDVLADDAGAVLTTGNAYRAARLRTLLTAVHTGDVSAFGLQGHAKVTSDISGVTGHIAGAWSYLECSSTATLGSASAAHYAMLDLPTSAIIAASSVASGIMIGSNTLAGTHTGKAAALRIQTPVAGAWDYALCISATNCGLTLQTLQPAAYTGKIAVCDATGASLGYIPLVTY